MSLSLGDYTTDSYIEFKFTTVNTSGVPTTLSGSPVVSVYKNGDTTQSTAGVTLTVDFDGVTGLNHVLIEVPDNPSFYVNHGAFMVVITAGTVGGSSVVGYVVAHFGIVSHHPRGTGFGFVTTGSTATSIVTTGVTPAIVATNQLQGRVIIFDTNTITAALRGQATDITANTAGGTLTVTGLTTAPASGDSFIIV